MRWSRRGCSRYRNAYKQLPSRDENRLRMAGPAEQSESISTPEDRSRSRKRVGQVGTLTNGGPGGHMMPSYPGMAHVCVTSTH